MVQDVALTGNHTSLLLHQLIPGLQGVPGPGAAGLSCSQPGSWTPTGEQIGGHRLTVPMQGKCLPAAQVFPPVLGSYHYI